MSTMPTIRIRDAHKYYNRGKGNELHVMNGINLELPASGMIAVFGRSGCGKTTLLNAIGGLDRIASGSIEVFGRDIREDTDTVRNRSMGYIFQNYNLNVSQTVYENVAAALRLCGMDDESAIAERVMAALSNVEMDKYAARTPDTLSGGQQQRVAIARALVKNPAIILADEPTGNLDEHNTVLVMDILKEISRTHLVLLVTHEESLVDFYCDRVIEIVDGRVESQRENVFANGYVQRNKNDIYLGELPRTETATPGVTVEYYGEPTEGLTLRIVHSGGKLYLEASDPGVKIIDRNSEIQLREGVFEATPPPEGSANARHLDMSALPPIEGKNFGRLYHWKNSLIAAWRENFSQKKKKSKRLLRTCLILLAVVMVFMTSTIGAGIKSYVDFRNDHNESLFYIPLDPEVDYSPLMSAMGTAGMAYGRLSNMDPLYDAEDISFRSGAFMTADTASVSTTASAQNITHLGDKRVLAGEGKLSASTDIIITSHVADDLLETSVASYIDTYEDLVGMISSNSYYSLGNARLRIAGVVESNERFFYMDSLMFARHLLNQTFYLPISPAADVELDATPAVGETVFYDNGLTGVSHQVGDRVTIMGSTFTVRSVIRSYRGGIGDYPLYVSDTYGEKLPDYPGEPSYYEWLFEIYGRYVSEFFKTAIAARPGWEGVSLEEWAIAYRDDKISFATLMGVDTYMAAGALLYREAHGHYPADDEAIYNFLAEGENNLAADEMVNRPYKEWMREYDSFMENRYADEKYSETAYVLANADYVQLVEKIGSSDPALGLGTYEKFDYGMDETFYTHHYVIHSDDPAATAACLQTLLPDDLIITPDEIYEENLDMMRTTVVIGVVSTLVVLGLMCLCIFFIMRSSFMSRVREVGILRAIGVTRKNLVFRFAVETALLIILTMGVGYLLSSLFIASLAGAPLFSTIFYFPIWMAVGLFAVAFTAGLLFGVLPAILLLRKTPSEILAKYDI